MTWQIGDGIPLTLSVPDGDENTLATATYSVLDDAGAVVTSGIVDPPPITNDDGKTWIALQNLVAGGTWSFDWTITGPGAGKETYTVYVSNTPPVPWYPSFRQVADYVPSRTVPVNTPVDTPQLTFDLTTRPTGEQVSRLMRSAVGWVSAACGTIAPVLYGFAQDVAALRTAGLVELSYPDRDGDVPVSVELLSQADKALEKLRVSNETATGSTQDPTQNLVPQWSFPDPDLTEDPMPQRTSDWGGMSKRRWNW